MARNKSGHVIHPQICVTKQLTVNFHSDYDSTQNNTGIYSIFIL